MVQDGVWGKGEKRGPTFPRPHVLAPLHGLGWDPKWLPRVLVSNKKSLKFKTYVHNMIPSVCGSLPEESSFDFPASPEAWHHSISQLGIRIEPKASGCHSWH